MGRPPYDAVLAAFGLRGTPEPLPGGQATAWRVGGAVLKPLDTDPALLAWQAEVLGRLDGRPDLRVAPPLRTADGRWSAHGWSAWRYERGRHLPGRWRDVLAVGERLHAALADEPEPAFLAARTDRWAVADRVAWGELPAAGYAGTRHLASLTAALRPLRLRAQLVHGDLTGNVLFDEHLPPAVIDLSPYWRPPAYAAAVVLADALVFQGADERDVEPLLAGPAAPQCLLRALVFRAVADHLARPARRPGEPDPYEAAVGLALRLAALG